MGTGLSVTINETPDGRRIVHYDGQSFELTPSLGEVICPASDGTALHHSRNCTHMLGHEDGWKVYPDPAGDLWQRLLEAGPADDVRGRQAFAEGAGLRNGAGRPVFKLCQTCTCVPLPSVGGISTPTKPLSRALAEFDRSAHADQIARADAEIAQVLRDFPLDSWPTMPLERYALGTDVYQNSFCHRMEFGTDALCSMKGGSAAKHIIFRRKKEGIWRYPLEYDDEQAAWENVRAGFVEAFEIIRGGRLSDIDTIDSLRPGPALTAKAISCYFPGALIPVTSRQHVRAFIFQLSGEHNNLDAFAAHERLKQVVGDDGRFAGWHPYEIGKFLYEWADPRPATTTILKVAPGENAKYWDECLKGGYICIGWDEVGALSEYDSEEEFRAAFEEAYSVEYKGNKSKISAKANEVWRLYQLKPGDLVVANKGTKEVLGVGTVTEEGYRWRDERPVFQHTVSVNWDTGYAQILAAPQKSWGTVTVAKVSAELWKSLQVSGTVGRPESKIVPADPLFTEIAGLLRRKGQVVLYGPPGTGKTYTTLRFALWWLATQMPELGVDALATYGTAGFQRALSTFNRGGYLTQVTFHPAYGYEDFIEGFRPAEGGDGGLQLVLRDGVFKRVCETAWANPERPYLLLIDEINRGDVPKILGELITLLEPDKRGLQVTLPTGGRFAVPSNVRILGTMNTADRSIRLLDSALRRRFAFHELLPDTDALDGQKVGDVDLGLLLRELNRRVVKELGRERQIGHSFFMPGGEPVDSEAELAAIVRTEVLPLLQEYAYDDYSMLSRFLGQEIVDVQAHTVAGLSDERLVAALSAELQASAGE
ncbi:AAA family ATPase [Actinomadura geliboluensis]|uniref:Restriction endonuclease n=1 Tax=Actinomadura geliboluensis TaxID=882440 RepID=A0A5S4HK07_9ACTN|nr:AAA family ATPase [Actinomadura geliboluensis]TMR40730.1 restriction endonuclease [Actinomadura geliboluensis]